MPWTTQNIPPLDGKNILITGANSGLGLVSAKALAQRGAHVILACRTLAKANAAADEIRAGHVAARLEPQAVDLTDLSSVRAFAREINARHSRLDVLLNNAGVMATPRSRTSDGFELQFGTNHLAHFALTGLLFELLTKTPDARVVSVSSMAHRIGKIRFDDPNWERSYAKWPAYGMSKLANLLFANELARRLRVAGMAMRSVAAHPGYASTNLQLKGPAMANESVKLWFTKLYTPLFAQNADQGALPQLYAAVSDDVESGDFIGPDGLAEMRGFPRKTRGIERAYQSEDMKRLWELSEKMTGVFFGL